MSKAAAVYVAVLGQLASDGRPMPTTGNEVMGATYLYNVTTITAFLVGVSRRLAADTPPLTFAWNTLTPATCLGESVTALGGDIAAATT